MTESEKQIQAMMDIAIPLLPDDGYGGYKSSDYQLAQKFVKHFTITSM